MSTYPSLTKTGTGSSAVGSLSSFSNPFLVGLHYQVSGTVNFDIQISPDDPNTATPTLWATPSGMAGLTANGVQKLDVPAQAVKVLVNSGTGTVTLYYANAGMR